MSPLVVSLLQAVDIIMYQLICVWMGLLGCLEKNILKSKIVWFSVLKKRPFFLHFVWGSPRNGGIHTTTHNSYTRLVAAIDGNPTSENGLHVIIHEPVNTYYSNSLSGQLFSFFFSVFWLRVAMHNQGMISQSGWILNFRRELLQKENQLAPFWTFQRWCLFGCWWNLVPLCLLKLWLWLHRPCWIRPLVTMPWCPIPVLGSCSVAGPSTEDFRSIRLVAL